MSQQCPFSTYWAFLSPAVIVGWGWPPLLGWAPPARRGVADTVLRAGPWLAPRDCRSRPFMLAWFAPQPLHHAAAIGRRCRRHRLGPAGPRAGLRPSRLPEKPSQNA